MTKQTEQQWRYERKFYFPNATKNDVEILIKTHPYGFKEIYYERQINSLYFDTRNFVSYKDNIDGSPNRAKIRLRWYGGDAQIGDDAVLEVKTKRGAVGAKLKYKVNDVSDLYIKNLLKTSYQSLKVVYMRKYFMSFDGKFRLTIDSNITYKSADGKVSHTEDGCVLELKYDTASQEMADLITNKFSNRIVKFSKYARGIGFLY